MEVFATDEGLRKEKIGLELRRERERLLQTKRTVTSQVCREMILSFMENILLSIYYSICFDLLV